MTVYEKLSIVQAKLKAPKGQYNSFGKYRYRSCEDILEAVKPILAEQKATIVLSDEVIQIGDRFYIRCTAKFIDTDSGEDISNTAYAREDEQKKGMDGSQISGTASSYCRKYCLNGLLLIDDSKDADTDAYTAQQREAAPPPLICADCGKPLYEVPKKDGTPWSITDQYAYSVRKFDKCLCADCMKKENAKSK